MHEHSKFIRVEERKRAMKNKFVDEAEKKKEKNVQKNGFETIE